MSLIELHTGAIAAGGGCVARADDGRVVFVRHALPGERALVRITAETSSFLRADAVEILDASPDRVEPPCRFAGPGRCGGCDWQHIDVAAQRLLKAQLVGEQLRRVAATDLDVTVEEVPGAPDGLSWRTHLRFAVDRNGHVGLRRHRSHDIEVVDRCLIATPEVESLGLEQLRWPGASEIDVRVSPHDGRRVVSVSSAHRHLRALPPVEAGIVVDGRTRRRPDAVHFEVLGRSYRVSAGSFWQVHPGAAPLLAGVVLDVLGAKIGEHVVDLYAGVGLFAALIGDVVGPTGSVLAVERDRRAVADARHNLADMGHVEIRKASVSPRLVADVGHPDLVVLDPAREGAGRPVMTALAALHPRPRRIAYVSCDPASFARDLRVMLDAGWSMPILRAFDLFPMTEHVELVGLLEPPAS
jgi:tRNA/tmRNA/rRNA uracil-C5-methylase (TrmA/RlmC/RlmD family)